MAMSARKKPSGELDLIDCTVKELPHHAASSSIAREYLFVIVTETRVLTLSASSEVERGAWVKAIRSVQEFHSRRAEAPSAIMTTQSLPLTHKISAPVSSTRSASTQNLSDDVAEVVEEGQIIDPSENLLDSVLSEAQTGRDVSSDAVDKAKVFDPQAWNQVHVALQRSGGRLLHLLELYLPYLQVLSVLFHIELPWPAALLEWILPLLSIFYFDWWPWTKQIHALFHATEAIAYHLMPSWKFGCSYAVDAIWGVAVLSHHCVVRL